MSMIQLLEKLGSMPYKTSSDIEYIYQQDAGFLNGELMEESSKLWCAFAPAEPDKDAEDNNDSEEEDNSENIKH